MRTISVSLRRLYGSRENNRQINHIIRLRAQKEDEEEVRALCAAQAICQGAII